MHPKEQFPKEAISNDTIPQYSTIVNSFINTLQDSVNFANLSYLLPIFDFGTPCYGTARQIDTSKIKLNANIFSLRLLGHAPSIIKPAGPNFL